jgi:transglutaminase-like putative cysteine protease
MKIRVNYRALYAYDEPVSLSPHVMRLFPRDALQARVGRFDFRTNEEASVHWSRDLHDNMVASCFFPGETASMEVGLETEIELTERNPFGFLLAPRALRWPLDYDTRERDLLTRALGMGGTLDWPSALQPAAGSDTVDVLVEMNRWIHQNIAYERREEGEAFSPEETLRRGRGACRDTAVLLASALRAQGAAARLVSGYLWESVTDPGERKAESSLHAWTEVFLPGAGWVGLDPSNGVLVDHHYLAAAVGLVSADIAPVEGTYYADRTVTHRLESELRIERAETSNENLHDA